MLVALLMHERCFLFCGKELLPFLLSEYLVSSKALLNDYRSEIWYQCFVFYRSLGLFTDKDVYSKQEGNIQGSKNVIYMHVKIK